MLNLKKNLIMALSFLVVCISAIMTQKEAALAATVTNKVPITCQILGNQNERTYSCINGKVTGWIYPGDICTIQKIYSNGWVLVRYPVKNGTSTKTAYAKSSAFFCNVNFSTTVYKTAKNTDIFYKADLKKKLGVTTVGDAVLVTGSRSGNQQILYPYPGGYKLGFSKGKLSVIGETTSSNNAVVSNSTTLCSPVPVGCKFSKKTNDNGWYGYHDINRNVSTATPVYAIADGTVTYKQAYRVYSGVKKLTSYGNYIEFKSSNGIYTAKYCHLNRFSGVSQKISSSNTQRVSGCTGVYTLKTKTVKKGEVIGYIGSTGNSSGNHLHFELRKNGSRIDPTSVIAGLK